MSTVTRLTNFVAGTVVAVTACIPTPGPEPGSTGACGDGVIEDPGCTCDPAPGGEPVALPATYHNQNTQQWCWAAVGSELTDYFRGVSGVDCQFITAYFNQNGSFVDCCGDPGACYRPAQSMQEIQTALYQVGGLYVRVGSGPLPEDALRQELANGRPVVVGVTSSFSGHVVLVVGHDGAGNYFVHDPYYGQYTLPYAGLLQNPATGAVWSQTLYEITDDASRCVEYGG